MLLRWLWRALHLIQAFTPAHKDFSPEPVVGCSYLLLPSYHKDWCAVFWSVLERPPTESHELIQKISRQQNQERPAFSSPGLGKGQPCRSLMPSRAAVTWQASSTPPLCHTGSAAELAEPSLGPRAAQTPRPSVGRVQGKPSPQPRATGASSAGTGPGVPGPPPRDREPPRAGVLSDPLEPAARLHWQGFWSFRVTRRMKLTRITLKGL